MTERYVHIYGDACRGVAHGIKEGDPSSIFRAASQMATLVRDGEVLVPVPSRTGRATVTLALAQAIHNISGRGEVLDILEGDARESLYDIKKSGRPVPGPQWLGLRLRKGASLPVGRHVVLVDNVLATGTTMRAARAVIPGADALVYAKDNNNNQ